MRRLIVVTLFFIQIIAFGSCTKSHGNNEIALLPPEVQVQIRNVPVFIQKEINEVAFINIQKTLNGQSQKLTSVELIFPNSDVGNAINNIQLISADSNSDQGAVLTIGETSDIWEKTIIEVDPKLSGLYSSFSVSFAAKTNANIESQIQIKEVILEFDHQIKQSIQPEKHSIRFGHVVRQQGQDNCDTYRIPGIVTTTKGTLIVVYDARYNNSKDLQEDIDIGMSRSTDGGQTWEPMKIIMDMGEWGGKPQKLNGVGDPCILYDDETGTIWVAALWMSGATEKDMLWWASKPGISPEETGQFILAKSTDDGLTWSEPVNITEQIKKPGWQLLLQGPGRGISMENGTLVFPAQFKADIGEKALDGGQYTCHSTIVYSKDHGETWHIGAGAKSNTTEAQVVELENGGLMLNMRDDRNRKDKGETNGRAVAVTNDLGKTWITHSSSNSALPESNCMASIISADVKVGDGKKHVLFFSNPNNKLKRANMTIKASLDQGMTWPEEYQLELNEDGGYGYSCMTMIDEHTIGILYEGVKELYFQKIPVTDLLSK
uniref:sialidase family protein n=1 Tax=uncultured Draconibacterium sp. TaxID=1573823 RepID=UPI003217EF17